MSDKSTGGGLGFGGVLFIVFLVLKLTAVINWSWWWVTAPLWIPAGLSIGLFGIGAILVGIATIFESEHDRKVRKARESIVKFGARK